MKPGCSPCENSLGWWNSKVQLWSPRADCQHTNRPFGQTWGCNQSNKSWGANKELSKAGVDRIAYAGPESREPKLFLTAAKPISSLSLPVFLTIAWKWDGCFMPHDVVNKPWISIHLFPTGDSSDSLGLSPSGLGSDGSTGCANERSMNRWSNEDVGSMWKRATYHEIRLLHTIDLLLAVTCWSCWKWFRLVELFHWKRCRTLQNELGVSNEVDIQRTSWELIIFLRCRIREFVSPWRGLSGGQWGEACSTQRFVGRSPCTKTTASSQRLWLLRCTQWCNYVDQNNG